MKTLSQILSYLLPVLYLVVIYIYFIIYKGRNKNLASKSTWFLAALLLIHATEIAVRHITLKAIPLSTAHDALSFLAFSILFVYMIIELSLKNRGSGLFILPFAFILELSSTFNMNWQPETNPLLKNPLFAIHASISIMGYTALALSAIYALMYIIQNRNIKKHNLGNLFNQLPALTYLEKMSVRSVLIGIILLGVGILQGHIQADKLIGAFWPNDLKVIISDSVWLVYVIVYILSRRMKWRGVWMAYFSIAGFLFLILGGWTLVLYLSESFHEFY